MERRGEPRTPTLLDFRKLSETRFWKSKYIRHSVLQCRVRSCFDRVARCSIVCKSSVNERLCGTHAREHKIMQQEHKPSGQSSARTRMRVRTNRCEPAEGPRSRFVGYHDTPLRHNLCALAAEQRIHKHEVDTMPDLPVYGCVFPIDPQASLMLQENSLDCFVPAATVLSEYPSAKPPASLIRGSPVKASHGFAPPCVSPWQDVGQQSIWVRMQLANHATSVAPPTRRQSNIPSRDTDMLLDPCKETPCRNDLRRERVQVRASARTQMRTSFRIRAGSYEISAAFGQRCARARTNGPVSAPSWPGLDPTWPNAFSRVFGSRRWNTCFFRCAWALPPEMPRSSWETQCLSLSWSQTAGRRTVRALGAKNQERT